jgi:hypothetical protein
MKREERGKSTVSAVEFFIKERRVVMQTEETSAAHVEKSPNQLESCPQFFPCTKIGISRLHMTPERNEMGRVSCVDCEGGALPRPARAVGPAGGFSNFPELL